MTVNWTDSALRQLQAIHDTIARDSPRYASAMVDRLTRRTEPLAQFPEIGSVVREYQVGTIRELVEHPYRIIYKILSDRIDVLAIVHGARRLPPAPPE